MSEKFIQGAYNPTEHSHVEWSDERLHQEAEKVAELRKAVPYVGQRAVQMALRADLVMHEQTWRLKERHSDE